MASSSKSLGVYATAYVQSLPEHVNGVEELQAARNLLHDAPSITSYLLDLSIPREDKSEALRIAMPDASEETKRFLMLLAEQDVIRRLDRILELTKELYAASEDRTYAEVTSAVPLTNEEVTRIANALKQKLGKAVLIETQIDETIYGGMTVRIGDWVFDGSLRGNIQRLKNTLTV